VSSRISDLYITVGIHAVGQSARTAGKSAIRALLAHPRKPAAADAEANRIEGRYKNT